MGFVLDNSVAMRWILETSKKMDQKYADEVLNSLLAGEALVPNFWHLEVVNVLLGAEKKLEINAIESEQFISQLDNLPILVDPNTSQQAFSRIIALARIYNLSSYDASYLELAIRTGLPLATLDKQLINAAKKSAIPIYLKD